jgi:hypothetical protein
METLKQVLMRRDKLSSDEADDAIEEAKALVADGLDPEDVLHDVFGLEADWVFDLLD